MVALLFIAYPLYLLILTLAVYLFTAQWYSLLLLLIIPFTGWACLHLKRQMD